MLKPKVRIGWREYVDLPELGLEHVPAKIDTGAQTSALHVDSIKPYDAEDGTKMVRVSFRVRHNPGEKPERVHRELPVAGLRQVMSSNGTYEDRWVIRTVLALGGKNRTANFTLTNRARCAILSWSGAAPCAAVLKSTPANHSYTARAMPNHSSILETRYEDRHACP